MFASDLVEIDEADAAIKSQDSYRELLADGAILSYDKCRLSADFPLQK